MLVLILFADANVSRLRTPSVILASTAAAFAREMSPFYWRRLFSGSVDRQPDCLDRLADAHSRWKLSESHRVDVRLVYSPQTAQTGMLIGQSREFRLNSTNGAPTGILVFGKQAGD
jgi:hypothetical protein